MNRDFTVQESAANHAVVINVVIQELKLEWPQETHTQITIESLEPVVAFLERLASDDFYALRVDVDDAPRKPRTLLQWLPLTGPDELRPPAAMRTVRLPPPPTPLDAA